MTSIIPPINLQISPKSAITQAWGLPKSLGMMALAVLNGHRNISLFLTTSGEPVCIALRRSASSKAKALK